MRVLLALYIVAISCAVGALTYADGFANGLTEGKRRQAFEQQRAQITHDLKADQWK